MGDLHAIGAFATLAGGIALALIGGGVALLDRGHRVVEVISSAALAVFLVQALIGVLMFVGGAAPSEILHLAYGTFVVVLVPLGTAFTKDASPRVRAIALAVAGILIVFLAWRLFVTG